MTIGEDEALFQGTRWGDRIRVSLIGSEAGFIPTDENMTIGIFGYAGDDTIRLDAQNDSGAISASIDGGDGADRITATAFGGGDFSGPFEIEAHGGDGDDSIRLSSRYNTAYGDGGDDTIRVSAGAGSVNDDAEASNWAYGGAGADRITATLHVWSSVGRGDGVNFLEGGAGDDRISATITTDEGTILAAHSELYGGAGNDRLSVRGGEGNILNGGAGDDTLIGGDGSDTLIGLQGDDALQGKGGADIFLFGNIRSGERDRISDFVIGEDVIDLSQIDANRDRAGEQSFRFGTREGTGRAWIEEDPDTTGSILYADDGRRVLEVLLRDGRGVDADDYSASDFLL